MNIAIINGPNLNLIGTREPEIYGMTSLLDYFETLKQSFPEIKFSMYQSNVEGQLINEIQHQGFKNDGLILNAGGYSHTSVAIADAVKAIPCPVIEVHISNIFAREEFRKQSFLSPVCKGVITGLGLKGYELAIRYLLK